MIRYHVGFPSESIEKHFEKELACLDRNMITRIKGYVELLAEHPRPPGKKFKFLNPPVAVYSYAAKYRLRIGDYRILYDVDDVAKKVILLGIKRRSEKTYR